MLRYDEAVFVAADGDVRKLPGYDAPEFR